MKKTISVNLGGIVFNINEDAYEDLQKYLNTVESYFDESSGRKEIMEDIEARMAELISERIKNTNRPVSKEDVEYAVNIMGRPEEFAEDHGAESESFADAGTKPRKRLYRDGDNSMIGGVCSGMGHYLGTDPTWIRIVWIIAFIGFGVGLLIYLLLWVIIPKARTTAEKLEMRGKPVNFNTIGRSVEVEAEHLKDRFTSFSRSKPAKNFMEQTEKAANKTGDFLAKAFRFLIKLIRKILGVALLAGGVIGIFALAVGILGSDLGLIMIGVDHDFTSYSYHELSDLIFENQFQLWAGLSGTLLLTTSPLLAIAFVGIALLRYPRKVSAAPGWLIFAAFILGIFSCIYAGFTAASDFAKKASYTERRDLTPASDTIYLSAMSEASFSRKYEGETPEIAKGEILFFDPKEEYFYTDQAVFDIQSSRDTVPRLVLTKNARGRTFEQADKRARNIRYQYDFEANRLSFSKYTGIQREDKWRAQNIDMLITLPVGTTVIFDEEAQLLFAETSRVKTNTFTMTRGGLKKAN